MCRISESSKVVQHTRFVGSISTRPATAFSHVEWLDSEFYCIPFQLEMNSSCLKCRENSFHLQRASTSPYFSQNFWSFLLQQKLMMMMMKKKKKKKMMMMMMMMMTYDDIWWLYWDGWNSLAAQPPRCFFFSLLVRSGMESKRLMNLAITWRRTSWQLGKLAD